MHSRTLFGLTLAAFLLLLGACGNGPSPGAGAQSAAAAHPPGQPTKWALLVGIDDYEVVDDLAGAENDVQKMRALLVSKFEFPAGNIRTLINRQATGDAIIQAFRDHLIGNARHGDIVVFHFSGHGSQMPDISGDETDQLDETIVPQDSRQPGKFDIPDDLLNGLMTELGSKTENIVFVLDACHSGTGVRATGRVRAIPTDDRPPPSASPFSRSQRGVNPTSLLDGGANFVLLSGSRSDQSSFEYYDPLSDMSYGAFTFFFSAEVGKAGPGATYRDVMDHVRSQVGVFYPAQSPQLEGAGADAFVFSDSVEVAEPYVLASMNPDGSVRLEAGGVHGITEGSVFEVYPPGTKSFDDSTSPTAEVTVSATAAFYAQATISSGGPVAANSRAVEREHAYGQHKLLVYYEGIAESVTLQQIRNQLEDLSHIQEHPDPYGYTLLLREVGNRIVLEGPDTVPLSPSVATSHTGVVDEVSRQVEEWAAWFNTLAVDNLSSTARLEVTLTDESGAPVTELTQGQTLDMVVKNGSNHNLFISVIDLSTDGSVSQVFPNPMDGGSELLQAGATRTMRFPGVAVPEGRDLVRDHLKVFAATNELDLRPLFQGAIRGAAGRLAATRSGPPDPLSQILERAAIGSRAVPPAVRLSDWTTAQRAILIRR